MPRRSIGKSERLSEQEQERPASEQPGWREWMRQLGRQLRRLRDFAGLSQEQLARLAGVSQPAVSRLEGARGLGTPLLVVVKITFALSAELRKLDPTMLDPELRRALDSAEPLGPFLGVFRSEPRPVAADRHLETLLRLYRETPEHRREAMLAIMGAAVSGL